MRAIRDEGKGKVMKYSIAMGRIRMRRIELLEDLEAQYCLYLMRPVYTITEDFQVITIICKPIE